MHVGAGGRDTGARRGWRKGRRCTSGLEEGTQVHVGAADAGEHGGAGSVRRRGRQGERAGPEEAAEWGQGCANSTCLDPTSSAVAQVVDFGGSWAAGTETSSREARSRKPSTTAQTTRSACPTAPFSSVLSMGGADPEWKLFFMSYLENVDHREVGFNWVSVRFHQVSAENSVHCACGHCRGQRQLQGRHALSLSCVWEFSIETAPP